MNSIKVYPELLMNVKCNFPMSSNEFKNLKNVQDFPKHFQSFETNFYKIWSPVSRKEKAVPRFLTTISKDYQMRLLIKQLIITTKICLLIVFIVEIGHDL